ARVAIAGGIGSTGPRLAALGPVVRARPPPPNASRSRTVDTRKDPIWKRYPCDPRLRRSTLTDDPFLLTINTGPVVRGLAVRPGPCRETQRRSAGHRLG